MQRVATIYIGTATELTPGIRALLNANEVDIVSIDISNDTAARCRVLENAGVQELPVVELDGTFSGGRNIVQLARALGLNLARCQPKSVGACC